MGVGFRQRYGSLLNNFTAANALPVFQTTSQGMHPSDWRASGRTADSQFMQTACTSRPSTLPLVRSNALSDSPLNEY